MMGDKNHRNIHHKYKRGVYKFQTNFYCHHKINQAGRYMDPPHIIKKSNKLTYLLRHTQLRYQHDRYRQHHECD